MKFRFFLSLALMVAIASGCAPTSPRRRLARTLVASGAVAAVLGGLVTAGCVDTGSNGGCGGSSGSSNLAAGVPIMVVGAALITAGLLVRPRRPSPMPRLFKPSQPQPIPVLPDPFVQPLPEY